MSHTDPSDLRKPPKGEKLLSGRQRHAALKAQEQTIMRQAKKRDGGKCRFPRCRFTIHNLPIDACHETHRGMGGNPQLDRTTREGLVSLCRVHHGRYDAGELLIEPMLPMRFDGPCQFFERNPETGQFEHVATETHLGVSVTKGA